MAKDNKFVQTSALIPPPPGGGSWRWDGKQWQARNDRNAALMTFTPAIPSMSEDSTVIADTGNTD